MAKKKASRSSNDGRPWKCRCGTVNKPTKYRFFKLPAFQCAMCERKLALDFKFCLGDIEARGKSLIGEVLDQEKSPICVAFAYAKAAEITERVHCIRNRIDPDSVRPISPLELEDRFAEKFPGVPSEDCLTKHHGMHKVLHMGLILRSEGIERVELVEMRGNTDGPYKAADVSSIPRDDFQKICEAMADGSPLVATYLVGKRRGQLPYCKIYKSPALTRIKSKIAKKMGHAVVLLGGGMRRGKPFFYFLSSWGKKFCPRRNKRGEIIRGGIGKIRPKDLTKNVIKLSPPNEEGGESRLQDQSEFDISNINYILMTAKKKQSSSRMLQRLRQDSFDMSPAVAYCAAGLSPKLMQLGTQQGVRAKTMVDD